MEGLFPGGGALTTLLASMGYSLLARSELNVQS
jgi:hypothetical protein